MGEYERFVSRIEEYKGKEDIVYLGKKVINY